MDPDYPIIIVGIDDLDFENDPKAFEQLNQLLHQPYKDGVHYLNLTITP